MELLSMTDFVLGQTKKFEAVDQLDYLEVRNSDLSKIENYAKFLKKPLKLEMFVPCDEEGNVLDYGETHIPTYQKAKEKVLFEDLRLVPVGKENNPDYYLIKKGDKIVWISWNDSKTVESIIHNDLTLTPSALNLLTIK